MFAKKVLVSFLSCQTKNCYKYVHFGVSIWAHLKLTKRLPNDGKYFVASNEKLRLTIVVQKYNKENLVFIMERKFNSLFVLSPCRQRHLSQVTLD